MPIDDNRHLSEEEQFCLEGCSKYAQYHHMRTGFETKACAFCNPDPELNKIVWQDEHFMVWHVHEMFMRKESLTLHILIVPKRHIRYVADLTDEEGVSLIRANRFAREHFGYIGGLNHVREGDMRYNAGTVPHLHFNLYQPSFMKEVRVPVFKDPSDREANRVRTVAFAERYEAGEVPT